MKKRQQWKNKFSFILAASGSAIGLGNIVFFSANAYKFGAGAFYIPYFIALFTIGIPIMILELGIGYTSQRAFPEAMHRTIGRKGEFIGWLGIFNATFICMYYITILAWVLGMLLGFINNELTVKSVAIPAFNLPNGAIPNPVAYFFKMISEYKTIFLVIIVWLINILIVLKGTKTIEKAVEIIVPLMWILMIVLIIRGLTLPNGIQGVYHLFTPDFKIMKDISVWQGAFSQIFFTLSLGFGIMTAYASYLPKKSAIPNSGILISLMNCGFEYIAGLAIFSLLFAFAIIPKASTLSMMFFVVPAGIASLPAGVKLFGILFFLLLFLAGISSSISLVEALVSAITDKFEAHRRNILFAFGILGCIGSVLFALPDVIDKGLKSDGTLGLSLIDLIDHWAFSYGLIFIGICECILIGYFLDLNKFRDKINKYSKIKLGKWFNYLIKYYIPVVLSFILIFSLKNEFKNFYGMDFETGALKSLPVLAFCLWFFICIGVALFFTYEKKYTAPNGKNNNE